MFQVNSKDSENATTIMSGDVPLVYLLLTLSMYFVHMENLKWVNL